jgi:hypothetical protein
MALLLVAASELNSRAHKAHKEHMQVLDVPWSFKFVMFCSGHQGVCPESQRVIQAAQPLTTPSLHVFGAPGLDKQVPHDASAAIVQYFVSPKVLIHDKGHIIPSSKADVQQYLEFMYSAMVQNGAAASE